MNILSSLSTQTRRRLEQGLLSGLVGLAIAYLLLFSGVLSFFEARTYDWRVRFLAKPGQASQEVQLIFLDQQSLDWGSRENGLSWPWPREVYGIVLDFCRRAGAKSLAFDVLYTEPSKYGVDDDRAMAQAGADFARFALPVFLGRDNGEATAWPDYANSLVFRPLGLGDWLKNQPNYNEIIFPRASFPVPELASRTTILGNVHQDPDPDGVYRRVGLFSLFADRVVPSLGLASYLIAHPKAQAEISKQGLRLDGKLVPLDPEGRAVLNFRGPSGSYKSYSAAAIIQSELRLREGGEPTIDPSELKDKYVFFGFSAPGLFDLRPAPVSGVYSGVEIHAQALDNLLSEDFLVDTPALADFALAALLGLAAALFSSLGASTLRALITAAIFLPLPLLLAFGGYKLGYVLPLLLLESSTAGSLAVSVLFGYAREGRQKRFIKGAFKQYLSPAVIEQLIQNPDKMKLGGERRVLSIVFSDLQGFTSLSEGLSPEDLTQLLNEYLSAMTDIIMEEGGTVDKYEGDAIIAFWNAPLDQPDHASRALRACLRAQDKLAELRPYFRGKTGKDLLMRIGLNTGPAVVGNMGSHSRFDYTMLGDSVNLASRLEGVNKQFGTFTMISQAALEATQGEFAARELGKVGVVGRKEPVTVFEPMWPKDYAARAALYGVFAEALKNFYAGDIPEALALFSSIAEQDPAAQSYVNRCQECLETPPSPDWDGVCRMTSK